MESSVKFFLQLNTVFQMCDHPPSESRLNYDLKRRHEQQRPHLEKIIEIQQEPFFFPKKINITTSLMILGLGKI